MRVIGQLTDEDIAKSSQALAELLNRSLVGLGLVSITVLGATLLLDVEAQVLKEDDGTIVGLGYNLLDLGTDAIGCKSDALAEELLELGNNRLQGIFRVGRAVGAAEVGHEDDRLGAIIESVLDGRNGADDALVVGDGGAVEGHVEVDLEGN